MKKIVFVCLSILFLLGVIFLIYNFDGSKNSSQLGTYDGFGYDDDANGVWDDLDKYIVDRYPDNAVMQATLKQMAKALQTGVYAGSARDDSAAQAGRAAISKSLYCLLERTDGDIRRFDEESSLLEVEMLKGDPNRNKAYQNFNALLSGGFYGSDQKENPCEPLTPAF
ncbi:MAG: hypothetical protein GX627_03015 [Parcubacteria group bacterium]|jgi:hypothetical protein|nr:hypothetical protein [Parcubacteria group bacterium]